MLKVEYNEGGVSEEITAEIIVLAAGARSRRISLEGMEETSYLTSEDIFGKAWPLKPYKSLIIIGQEPSERNLPMLFPPSERK